MKTKHRTIEYWDARIEVFSDTDEVVSWLDQDDYEGSETADHIYGLYKSLKDAVAEIKRLHRVLEESK